MDVKPMCPYCGTEMKLMVEEFYGGKFCCGYAFCPSCGSYAPSIARDTNKEQLRDVLIAAALRRPMQKPLELAELEALISAGEDVAVYCEAKNDPHAYATILFAGQVISPNGDKINACDLVYFHYGQTWRAWAQRPTDEERAAAPWEAADDADL